MRSWNRLSIAGLFFIIVLVVVSGAVNADDGPGEDNLHGVGKQRLGIGSQFIYPSGGISLRYWMNSRLGFEGNAILWSSPGVGLDGTASLRVLTGLTDAQVVNFYLAGGAAYNFDNYGDSTGYISVIGTGGISFNIFSERFQVNLEFGVQGQAIDNFGMTFGSGFHYYF